MVVVFSKWDYKHDLQSEIQKWTKLCFAYIEKFITKEWICHGIFDDIAINASMDSKNDHTLLILC